MQHTDFNEGLFEILKSFVLWSSSVFPFSERVDFLLEGIGFTAVGFAFLGESGIFGDGGLDALVEGGDFGFAAD